MIRLNFAAVFLVMFLMISCQNYTLSKADLEWQPYRAGDVLILESNTGKVDSIWITDISSYRNPVDPLHPISDYIETLFVSGEYKDPSSKVKNKKYAIHLLRMKASERSYMNFPFRKEYGNIDYPETSMDLIELRRVFKENRRKSFLTLNDVIEIEARDISGFEHDAASFWWSKEYGYVKYQLKNGDYWELKSFVRNGKVVFSKESD